MAVIKVKAKLKVKLQIKVKCNLEQAITSQRWSRGIALLFL
jgi:hypothetical protein